MGYGSNKDYTRNPARNKEGLMPQEAKFAALVPIVGRTEAVQQAYPDATPQSQTVIASKNMGKDDIVLSISKRADKLGLTLDSGIAAVKKGLSEESPKAYLKAAELTIKLHGGLQDKTVAVPIPVSKEQFLELCGAFWGTKPATANSEADGPAGR